MYRILVLGGTGFATVQSIQAQAKLAMAQSLTQSLLAQQQKYIEVKKVQDEVSARAAAQQRASPKSPCSGVSLKIDFPDNAASTRSMTC